VTPPRLKLRRIRVSGFKSLTLFDLKLPEDNLALLIGPNGSGKSSFLQALSFIRYFIKGESSRFFADRGWETADISPRLKSGQAINHLVIEMHLSCDETDFHWGFQWNTKTGLTEYDLLQIYNNRKYGDNFGYIRNKFKVTTPDGKTSNLNIQGSIFNAIEPDENDKERFLSALKQWAENIVSLELMNPTDMRRGARQKTTDIGPRGEKLASFLASLSAEKKERIVKRLQRFYPIEGIETTKKKAGWVDLRIAEGYDKVGRIGSPHMSDGFMRLLGLAAIPEMGPEVSLVLLDEVENGIEPHILPEFIAMIAKESTAQIIATSHSPTLVNQFTPEQITLTARGAGGEAAGSGFGEIKPLMEGLEYFAPGEIWTNTGVKQISKWVCEIQEEKNEKFKKLNIEQKMHDFMEFGDQ
jgi:predicted ATPase